MDEVIYKFKQHTYPEITAGTYGIEKLSPYFKIPKDSGYEFPPIEVYLYTETPRCRKYRKTYISLKSKNPKHDILDVNNTDEILKIGNIISIDEFSKYKEILENVLVEEAKCNLIGIEKYQPEIDRG